jgi:hypothetical protein
VKNHDFTPKNHIFPILGGAREIFWGISCEKSMTKGTSAKGQTTIYKTYI